MKIQTKILSAQVSAIALSVLLAACSGGNAQQGGAGPGGMPPPEVDVMTVQPGNALVTRDLPGRLQAWRTAEVRARVEGIVEKRSFVEGSDVKAGATLFTIDPRSYKAAADSAKADVDLARLTVERYRPLLEIKAVSKQEFDQAEAKLKQAEAVLAKANIDLENTNVPAPISGRIGRALVTEGALVGRGEATPLATIEQVDRLYANFTQTATEMLQLQQSLRVGSLKRATSTKVEVVREDGSTYPQAGKLLFNDLAVDPNTGAINLRAEVPNPNKELLPGMYVRIRFPQAVADNVIRVPQRAVQANPQGQFVMVVDKDGKVAPRPIVVDGMSGSDWIVRDGLKAGEVIVVNGLQKAKPGGTVKPVMLSAEAAAAPAGMPTPGAKPAEPKPAENKPAEAKPEGAAKKEG